MHVTRPRGIQLGEKGEKNLRGQKKCGERNEPGGSLGTEKGGGVSAALSFFPGHR